MPLLCDNNNNRFGDDYATLKARVLKTLCDAAGPDKARSTMYGGFVAITMFGANAVNAFLLPLAMEYWPRWQSMLEQQPSSQSPQQQQPPSSVGVVGLEHQMELQMCEQAVLVRDLDLFLKPIFLLRLECSFGRGKERNSLLPTRTRQSQNIFSCSTLTTRILSFFAFTI